MGGGGGAPRLGWMNVDAFDPVRSLKEGALHTAMATLASAIITANGSSGNKQRMQQAEATDHRPRIGRTLTSRRSGCA